MKRIDRIASHPLFRMSLEQIDYLETDRIFCRHGLNHAMDVARIAYIYNLEENYQLPKELIYAAALVHDIGRWKQYQEGYPHDAASAELAKTILEDSGFEKDEIDEIMMAVLSHRKKHDDAVSLLSAVIVKADKESRICSFCVAYSDCYWPEEQKNHHIQI